MKSFLKKSLIFLTLFVMVFSLLPNTSFGQPATQPAQTTPSASSVPNYLATDGLTGVKNATTPTKSWLDAISDSVLWRMVSIPLFFIMKLAQFGLGIAGLLLNWVIKETVINLSDKIGVQGTNGGMAGIQTAWRVIRDLINMSFIFLLIYEGILVIFGKGNAKKVVTGIITAALLINFSMFFTKVIIDASNIVTVSLYNAIDVSGDKASSGGASSWNSTGFANSFMQALGISGFFSTETIASANSITESNTAIIYLGASLFMLVAMFVFLAISIMFVIRYLAFIILLIISPVGFVFGGVPGLSKLSNKFWETLWGQVIFAPLYMLMTWITLTIIGSDGFLVKSSGTFGKAFTDPKPTDDSIGIFLNFIMVIFLLIFTLTTAKKYATQGGIVTSKMISTGTALAGGAIFGGASLALRNTAGRYYTGRANNEELKARAKSGDKSAIAELERAQYLSNSSFDLRNVGPVKTQLKDRLDLDFGKGNRGFKEIVDKKSKDRMDKDKKFAESLKPSDIYTEEQKDILRKKLEDEEFMRKENERKREYLAKSDNAINAMKSSSIDPVTGKTIAQLETDITNSENTVKSINQDISNQNNSITQIQSELDKLNRDLSSATSKETKDQIQQTINQKTTELKDAQRNRGVLNSNLQTTKNVLNALQKNRDDAVDRNKTLKEMLNKREEDSEHWISEELTNLYAKAGGREEERYDKGERKGQVKTKAITSEYNRRVEGYAQSIYEKDKYEPGFFRSIFTRGVEQKDRVRAANMRKITKSDPNKDWKKFIKEWQKNQKDSGEAEEETATKTTVQDNQQNQNQQNTPTT